MPLPNRRRLPHEIPGWVKQGARHFITLTCRQRNQNLLAHAEVAAFLLESAAHYHRLNRWFLWLVMIMPDHVHLIATFQLDCGLKRTIAAWKGYQKRLRNIDWQPGFFEHRLRSEAEFIEKMTYVRMNPVRQGLVDRPDDWPYYLDYRGLTDPPPSPR